MVFVYLNHLAYYVSSKVDSITQSANLLFKVIYVISSWQCASAIDSLAAFYFNNITAGDSPPSPAALNLARHIGECPNLFPQVCVSILIHSILKAFVVIMFYLC
jgi:hypothetical protein